MIKSVQGDITQKRNKYVSREENPEMMGSEFSVIYLKQMETFEILAEEEYVFCLHNGRVVFMWDGFEKTVERKSCFSDEPYVLHIHSGTQVSFRCLSESAEINAANTWNEKQFTNRLYRPEDLKCSELVDEKKLDGKIKRVKRVFFDRSVCPETNLFCGEVVNYPGCWACFPPHLHVEPEIYYYRFLPAQGYGFAEFGNEAIKVVDRSLTCNPGGQLHSQVTAPGYAGYIMWTQRLLDNGEDVAYTLAEQHAWLDADDVAIFPELTEKD